MKGPYGVSFHSRNSCQQGVSAVNERMKGEAVFQLIRRNNRKRHSKSRETNLADMISKKAIYLRDPSRICCLSYEDILLRKGF